MDTITSTRPVWSQINLDHLAHNIREVRRLVGDEKMITAVIKADGYGHGAVHIGSTLLENGADRFAVATLSEAIQLRKAFPSTEIMIMGYTPAHNADQVIEHNIIQTLYNEELALEFSKRAVKHNKTIKIHVKLDTGMRRIGILADEKAAECVLRISQMEGLSVEGIFTHFACADEKDKTFTRLQVQKYLSVIEALESKGLKIPIKHVCNSAGIIDHPEYHFDMVRAGIMLYGLYPSEDVQKHRVELKEVMSLRAQIAQVKTVGPLEGVSYGLKFVAQEATQIATLPIGYADGFSRSLTFKAKGIVKGALKPIVGRICMDQCMMETNGLDVSIGDEVVLFGEQGNQKISIDECAKLLDTINYEIVCMIGKRVPRHYVKGGETILVEDFNLSYAKSLGL